MSPSDEGFFFVETNMKTTIQPVIMKFGGTSVSKKENLITICEIVKREKKRHPILVVSALSGITDLLVQITKENNSSEIIDKIRSIHTAFIESIWKDETKRQELVSFIDTILEKLRKVLRGERTIALRDTVLSYGEILSSHIISEAISSFAAPSRAVIATEIIITDTNFGNAEFLSDETIAHAQKVLLPLLKEGVVPVVTGFIGSTLEGKTTTLGRGGSDYTASILGYCLHAKEVQIWTDVNGIYTADPRIVKTVYLIPKISYREASELASFGAKVLHPRTIKPVIAAGIPLRVLNTFNPKSMGTLVTDQTQTNSPITAISHKMKVTLVNIYSLEMLHQKGFLAKVYNIFADNNISIDLVSSSEVSESIVLDNDDQLPNAVTEISKFAKVTVKKDVGMVSLIGDGIVAKTQTIKEIFEVLHKENILVSMVSLGAIDINVSLVVKSEEVEKAVRALHINFFKQ